MKEITITIAGTGGRQEFRDVRIMPGTRARDILSQLNLVGFQLMKPMGGAFEFNEDVYDVVTDHLQLFAAKADVEAGGMPLIETDLSWVDQPKGKRKPRVSLSQQERYKEDVKDRIRKYVRQSSVRRVIHSLLQFIIFAGAATVTVIIIIPDVPKWVPVLISGVVTIATASSNYYKFGERGIELYLTAEEAQQEYNWFITNRGPYKNLDSDEAFSLFMDRIEILMRTHTQRLFTLDKPGENRNKDAESKEKES